MKQHPKYPGYYVDTDGSVYSENYNRNQYGKKNKTIKEVKTPKKGKGEDNIINIIFVLMEKLYKFLHIG